MLVLIMDNTLNPAEATMLLVLIDTPQDYAKKPYSEEVRNLIKKLQNIASNKT